MNVMQDFDDSKLYESIADDEWFDANQWHSIRDQWYLVASSYKNAADLLVDELPDALLLGLDRVYIACPVMFLYRHYLELALKALMLDSQALGKQVHHNRTARNLEAKLPGHPLMKSWQLIKELLSELDDEVCADDAAFTEAKAIYGAIEEHINQFGHIDPKSFNFRYPTDRQGTERILAPLPGFQDLTHVKDIVEVVASYFDSIATWAHEERNRINEMPSDYR